MQIDDLRRKSGPHVLRRLWTDMTLKVAAMGIRGHRRSHRPSSAASGMLGRLGAFGRATGGIAAVEFAFIAPILLLLFLGTSEIGEVLRVSRRVDRISFTIADLVGQSSTMTTSEMNGIFQAADAILSPYSKSGLRIVVSVVSDKNKVVWSKAYNGATALSSGANGPVTVGANAIPSGTQLIVVEVSYAYQWLIATNWAGFGNNHGYTFDRFFSMRPRVSDTITFSS